MKRFRFRLSALLVLSTAVALFIGLAQARRRHIRSELEHLRSEHVYCSLNDSGFDKLWQRLPQGAYVFVSKLAPDKYKRVADWTPKPTSADLDAAVSGEVIIEECKELRNELHQLGVREVAVLYVDFKTSGHRSRQLSVEELSELIQAGAK